MLSCWGSQFKVRFILSLLVKTLHLVSLSDINMSEAFKESPFNPDDVPPIIFGGDSDSSVDLSFGEDFLGPVPASDGEHEAEVQEPLDETLASLPSEDYSPPSLNTSLEEELLHPKNSAMRVIDALKRSSILPVGDHSDHFSFGECFWAASLKAADLEKALHDDLEEECRVLTGVFLCGFCYLYLCSPFLSVEYQGD